MIDHVVLRPLNTPDGFAIDLYGDLAGILRVAQGDSEADSAATEEQAKSLRFILTDMQDAAQAEDVCIGTMVAGGRNRRSHMGASECATSSIDLDAAKSLTSLSYRLPEREVLPQVGIGGCGGRI